MTRAILITLAVFVLLPGLGSAETIRVPTDRGAIQNAIDAASDFDTVLVSPGIYAENIDFGGKAIVLLSTHGRDSTFIDAADPNMTIVRFISGEDTTSVIDGFTIRHSTNAIGIYCSGTNPVIKNCDVSFCFHTGDGAGIYCSSSGAKIRRNRIHDNHGTLTGGGIVVTGIHAVTLEIFGNEIYYNSSANGPGIGCGVTSRNVSIERNLIWGNVGTGGLAGGLYVSGQNFSVVNNTVVANSKGIMVYQGTGDVRNNLVAINVGEGLDPGSASFDYNDVWGNGSLNDPGANGISVDPLFIDSVNHVYALQSESPCIDAGDPDPQYNELDGTRNDIGVYPYVLGGPLPVNINYGPFAVGNIIYIGTPKVYWSYYDGAPTVQEQYELEVGADSLWDVAEMWATGTVSSSDTSVTYGGLPLSDHSTYYVRIRLHNGDHWGDWRQSDFFTHFSSLIQVPLDFPSIQAGIDATIDDDTVLVAEGHYYEQINLSGKSILIASHLMVDGDSNHILATVIDGDTVLAGAAENGSVVSADTDAPEPVTVRLLGFTIQSNVTLGAIGIYDDSYEVTISSCWISENDGISYLHDGSFLSFDWCTIQDNLGSILSTETSEGYEFRNCMISGATVEPLCACSISNSTLHDCSIEWSLDIPGRAIFNSALSGCVVYLTAGASTDIDSSAFLSTDFAILGSSADLSNSLVEGHSVLSGYAPVMTAVGCTFVGDFDLQTSGDLDLLNCIVRPDGGNAVTGSGGSSVIGAACCDIYGFDGTWIEGDFQQIDTTDVFFLDPYFCDEDSDDYYLYEISPCLPESNGCEIQIGAYGVGCEVGEPSAKDINFGDESTNNIVENIPTIYWSYHDILYPVQEQFEIAVGTDDDWEYAEMWNPTPYTTPDTSIVYAGAELDDGSTYWLRMRVYNSLIWSDWSELSFRMNTAPTAPSLVSPLDDALVGTLTPDLVLVNSSDAEDDSLSYIFEVSIDSFASTAWSVAVGEAVGSFTAATVDSPLEEDQRYWWRAATSDYFEESEWSDPATFYVDSENTLPTEFDLVYPPDSANSRLETLTPEFIWSPSFDSDPLDSVEYSLLLSIDSTFTFVNTISDIYETTYVYIDSLLWDATYWWKVKAQDQNDGEAWSNQVHKIMTVTLGDTDASGELDIDDVVYLIAYIFLNGPQPQPLFTGDTNCDGEIDIDDVVYLIAYIFSGGPPPCLTSPLLEE